MLAQAVAPYITFVAIREVNSDVLICPGSLGMMRPRKSEQVTLCSVESKFFTVWVVCKSTMLMICLIQMCKMLQSLTQDFGAWGKLVGFGRGLEQRFCLASVLMEGIMGNQARPGG